MRTVACLLASLFAIAASTSGCLQGEDEPTPSTAVETATETVPPTDLPSNKRETPPPTSTPIAPVGPECPVPDRICRTAVAIESQLNQQDLSGVMVLAGSIEARCPDRAGTLKSLAPLCDVTPGSLTTGYSIGVYAGRFQFVNIEAFRSSLAEALGAAPDRSYRAVGVGCALDPGSAETICSDFVISFSAFSPQQRAALVLIFHGPSVESARLVGYRMWAADSEALRGGLFDIGHQGLPMPSRAQIVPWSR